MVKVTIEHDDGTEVVEAEMFFGVGTTADEEDKTHITAKTVIFGEGNKRHLIATGTGVRRLVDSLEQAQDGATVAFLTGLAPECAPKPNPIQRLLAKFRKEEETSK